MKSIKTVYLETNMITKINDRIFSGEFESFCQFVREAVEEKLEKIEFDEIRL